MARSTLNTNCIDTAILVVKVGLLQIIAQGGGTGPPWNPEWGDELVNAVAALGGSAFSFSGLPSGQVSTFTSDMLFCCESGGSGNVHLDEQHVQCTNTEFSASTSLNAINGLPGWLQAVVGVVQALFPNDTALITAVQNLINLSAGFTASGSADFKLVTFSDTCWGCTANPQMYLGGETANVNGEVAFHSDFLGLHVIALRGYVNWQKNGWVSYIGPSPTGGNWYVRETVSYHLYSSYVVGQESGSTDRLGPDTKYFPPELEPVPVCLGPNFAP